MPLYAIEQKWLGLAKETTRGQAVAPTKFYPIGADTEMEYKLNHIEDELLRGRFEKYPPYAGTKEGSGTINLNVNAKNIGEFLYSLLGSVETTDIGGAGNAYRHIFKRSNSITMPSYTITVYRGINAKQYPLSVVKTITFSYPVDNIVKASIHLLFQSEINYTNPPTPTFTEQDPFMFHNVIIKIGGNQVNNIKDMSITIDNGSVPLRALRGSQDIYDIVSHAKLTISGSFNVYFENEDERIKFLSNTSNSLEIISTGDVIEPGHNYRLEIKLPQIHYTAYPFSNLDGLLGASVSFNSYYNQTANNSVEITLINTNSSY